MEIEYSNEVKGRVHAYRFETWEKLAIAQALKPVIKKLYKKIEKIEKHPKNEGQVTYSYNIRMIRFEIEVLENTVKNFQ